MKIINQVFGSRQGREKGNRNPFLVEITCASYQIIFTFVRLLRGLGIYRT